MRCTPKEVEELEALAPNILVVDDKAVNRRVAGCWFTKLGWECDYANDGNQAVDAVKKRHYSAVFMDCLMPEMDGYDATRAIRAHELDKPHRTLILAMSASAMKADQDRALDSGMDDFVAKPVIWDEIELELLKYLIRRELGGNDTSELKQGS